MLLTADVFPQNWTSEAKGAGVHTRSRSRWLGQRSGMSPELRLGTGLQTHAYNPIRLRKSYYAWVSVTV